MHDPIDPTDPWLPPSAVQEINDALAAKKAADDAVGAAVTAAGTASDGVAAAMADLTARLADLLGVLGVPAEVECDVPADFVPSPGVQQIGAEIDAIALTAESPLGKQRIAAFLRALKPYLVKCDFRLTQPDSAFPSSSGPTTEQAPPPAVGG